ncbi:MAG: phosphoenolpyruvate carboxykinase (GTP), partial [Clostridiaceae bacterium]|nr:phosphoenolpyruvate carboxykinase (GTP) [Clostridiaceae bacterium]
LRHWLSLGGSGDQSKLPKIFSVNWFRRDSDGHFLWPGFGENSRVLAWVVGRCAGTAGADKTAIGYLPRVEDLDLTGLEIDPADMEEVLRVDKDAWLQESEQIEENFKSYGERMPQELFDELEALKKRLSE